MIDKYKQNLELSFWEIIIQSIPLSIQCMLTYIPAPLSLYFLKFHGTTNSQAYLTLFVTYNNLTFTHLIAIQSCIVLGCTKYLYQKKDGKFWESYFSICIIDFLLLSYPILATIYCREILEYMNFDHHFVTTLPPLIKSLFAFKIVENVNNLLVGLLLVQKTIKEQYYINIISLTVFLSVAYYVFIVRKM